MAAKIAWTLAKKAAWNMLPFANEPTERVEPAGASQALRFFLAPSVVFTDPRSASTMSVGSGFNAAYLQQDAYDMVVNCCPDELSVSHPVVRTVGLRDTNFATLDCAQMETLAAEVKQVLSQPAKRVLVHCWVGASRSVAVAAYLCCRIYPVQAQPLDGATLLVDGATPLVDGATPLVDGATLLVDGATLLVDGATLLVGGAPDGEHDSMAKDACNALHTNPSWEHYYAAFKSARPSISVSTRLKSQVLQLLLAAGGSELPEVAPVLASNETLPLGLSSDALHNAANNANSLALTASHEQPIAAASSLAASSCAASSSAASSLAASSLAASSLVSSAASSGGNTVASSGRPPPPDIPTSDKSSEMQFDYSDSSDFSEEYDSDDDDDSEATDPGDRAVHVPRPTYANVVITSSAAAATTAASAAKAASASLAAANTAAAAFRVARTLLGS